MKNKRANVYKIQALVNGQWIDYDGREYVASEVCHRLNELNLTTYYNNLQFRKVFSRVATIY